MAEEEDETASTGADLFMVEEEETGLVPDLMLISFFGTTSASLEEDKEEIALVEDEVRV